MTEQQLRQYRENREQIEYYKEKILEIQERGIDSFIGKVKGSQKEFPYIQRRYSVPMKDPIQEEKVKEKIAKYREKITRLIEENEQIENYIEDIKEFQIKKIFELYFVEGKKQEEIARQLHITQSFISKKIKQQIKKESKNLNIDCHKKS